MNDEMKLRKSVSGKIIATYDYTDEDGQPIFQIVRYDPKDFRARRPDGKGGWIWNLEGLNLTLYRLPEVKKAGIVLILEGEKDVETAYQLKLPAESAATTSPLGAGQWLSQYAESLRGKRVIICPDNDIPGKQHMIQIVRSLSGKAAEILIIRLPESVKDLSEWIQAGATPQQFAELMSQAEVTSYEKMIKNN